MTLQNTLYSSFLSLSMVANFLFNDRVVAMEDSDDVFSPYMRQRVLAQSKDDNLPTQPIPSIYFDPSYEDESFNNENIIDDLFPELSSYKFTAISININDTEMQKVSDNAVNQTATVDLSYVFNSIISSDDNSDSNLSFQFDPPSESDEDPQSENFEPSNIKKSIEKKKYKKRISLEVFEEFKSLYSKFKGTKKYVEQIMKELQINEKQYVSLRDKRKRELNKSVLKR